MHKKIANRLIKIVLITFLVILIARGNIFLLIVFVSPAHFLTFVPWIVVFLLPLMVVKINKLFPGERLSRLDTFFELLYISLWAALCLDIVATFFVFAIDQAMGDLHIDIIAKIMFAPQTMLVILGSTLVLAVIIIFRALWVAKKADNTSFNTFTRKLIARKRVKRWLITYAALLVVFLACFVGFDMHYRSDFTRHVDPLHKAVNVIIKPAGGVINNEQSRGDGVVARSSCFLLTCPALDQSWVVPIEPGQELNFMQRFLTSVAATEEPQWGSPRCSAEGGGYLVCNGYGLISDGGHINISIQEADAFHNQIPNKDIAPKIWRFVRVGIY
jgi:hypothetical protein